MADALASTTADSIDDPVIFEMLRQWYFDDALASTIGTWVLSGFFWLAVAESTAGASFVIWALGLGIGSSGVLFLRKSKLELVRWRRRAFVIEASIGFLWGSIMLIAPPADQLDQMIVAVLLNSVILTSAVAMGQFLRLFLAFAGMTAATGLLGFWMNAPETRVQVTIVVFGVLFYSTAVAAQQSEGQLRLASALQRNENLAEDLSNRNTALERANTRLDDLAHTDALTQVHNRYSFERLLHSEMQALIDGDDDVDGLRLAYLDIDRFKAVNDNYGHRTGDKVLQIVAQRLGAAKIAGEHAARLGGDEMVLLGRGSDAQELGRRLMRTLGEPITIDGVQLDIGVSVGVAATTVPVDPDVLVRQADVALYDAKFAGGQRFVVAGGEVVSALRRQPAIESSAVTDRWSEPPPPSVVMSWRET